jgi:hypothetical protein
VTLESVQRTFWSAMRDSSIETGVLDRCFRGDARLGARERMLIYRRAYWARQIEALRDEFRRLAGRLREPAFSDLMHEYLLAHPSPDPRIEWIGRALPLFLRGHPSEACRALADLAAFEWAEVEVLLAPDPPVTTTSLDVSAGDFAACSFEMLPALRVLAFASDPLTEPGDCQQHAAAAYAFWRFPFTLQHRRLDPDEHAAATAALAGEPVATKCQAFCQRSDAAHRATAVLRAWLQSGWVCRIVRPTESRRP